MSASNPILAKLPSSFTCLIVFWCSSCRMALHGGYVRVLETSSELIFMRFLAVSGKPKIKETSQWLSIHLSCNQILITPTHSTKLIPRLLKSMKMYWLFGTHFLPVISPAANSVSYCKQKLLTSLQCQSDPLTSLWHCRKMVYRNMY